MCVCAGVAIVISPLIALMQDQIANLAKRRVIAKTLNSSIPAKQQTEILADLDSPAPSIKLLYVTPEQGPSAWRCLVDT